MKKSHRNIPLLLLVFLLSLFSACSGTKEPETIKVIFLPYLSNSPLFIAAEEGFFDEQGITIELIEMDASSMHIPALEQGEVDVIGGALSSGKFNAMARGATIKIVADKGHMTAGGCVNSALLASKNFLETNSPTSKSDLAGKHISTDPASITGYYVEVLLGQSNLSMDDVEISNLKPPAEFEIIKEGTIDLAVVDEPWLTRILQAGFAEIWVANGDLVPGMSYTNVYFGPNLLKETPELGKKFMVAYLKGVAQYSLGKTDRNLEIVEKFTGLDKELLREACWVSVNLDGTINHASVHEFQQWTVDKDLQDEILTKEQYWDPRFIEFAAKELNLP